MSKVKIMIVEDEVIIAMDISAKLKELQYEVCRQVMSGEQAIKNVEEERPDIVLMDIILKGEMNGIEAAREIRTRYGIPIIFMTACIDEETMKQMEDVKPAGFFIKPVEIEDLKPDIENALRKDLQAA